MAPITTARLATCVVAATLVSAAAATLPTEALADDGPASVPVGARHGAVTRHRRGARGGGERRGRRRDRRRARRGGTGDGAGGACGRHATAAPSAATPVETVPPSRRHLSRHQPSPIPRRFRPIPRLVSPQRPRRPLRPAATAVQTSPTNVNVSVRIGSPGDNGPVTQVNVAAAVTSAASATGSGASSAPIATTAAPSTTSGAHASTPASQPAAASSSTAQDDPETWTWQWNCLSNPDLSVISPVGSTTGSASEELDMDLELRGESSLSIKTEQLRSINRRT